jgi:hypothetical protein
MMPPAPCPIHADMSTVQKTLVGALAVIGKFSNEIKLSVGELLEERAFPSSKPGNWRHMTRSADCDQIVLGADCLMRAQDGIDRLEHV